MTELAKTRPVETTTTTITTTTARPLVLPGANRRTEGEQSEANQQRIGVAPLLDPEPDLGEPPAAPNLCDFAPPPTREAVAVQYMHLPAPQSTSNLMEVQNHRDQYYSPPSYNNLMEVLNRRDHYYPPVEPTAPSQSSSAYTSEDDGEDARIVTRATAVQQNISSVFDTDVCEIVEHERLRGVVQGVRSALCDIDFVCPHCLETEPGAMVVFPCCARRAHYGCMARNLVVHQLAMHRVDVCIQCLRPIDLIPHDTVLSRYGKQWPIAAQDRFRAAVAAKDSNEASRRGRASAIWGVYESLSAHMQQKGLIGGIKDFVKSEDRSRPPDLDADRIMALGMDVRTLIGMGWSLATIAEEFRLYNLDDPLWAKLRFDRNTLLELTVGDMMFFMNEYRLHPYEVRATFGIRLPHLWRTAEHRRRGGRGSSGIQSPPPGVVTGSVADLGRVVADRIESGRKAKVTARAPRLDSALSEQAYERLGLLSPTKLAVLGFNLHHLIIMGFEKSHFANFPYFTMHDWVYHLGFCKSHWNLLGLTRNDFAPGGVFGDPDAGWNANLLANWWRATANDRESMGLLTSADLARAAAPIVPAVRPPPSRSRLVQRRQHQPRRRGVNPYGIRGF